MNIQEDADRILRWITFTIIVGVIVCGILYALPIYNRTEELKAQSERLSREIEARNRDIARLKDYQRRFRTDPDFVERIARQNNKIYPGELVFLFEDEKN